MAMYTLENLPLSNRIAELGEAFYRHIQPTPLPAPQLLHFNAEVAALIGLDPAQTQRPEFTEIFAGNRPLAGARPLATVYAGHQFGQWVPQLGDGRALLIAETQGPDGTPWELQLKGAGPTPYSRHADGRAVLRSSIREYLCSEAMHALGIPTTRALSLIGSPLPVRRETLETAAVVCRMAPSFIRFGHFEWAASQQSPELLKRLTDAVITQHFPQHSGSPSAWLRDVCVRTAQLMAQWQTVGFCHGVMNTDNMSILGLTLDYGPFGFLDTFDSRHICNHSDEDGRYAWDQQPRIGHWNIARLIEAVLPLLHEQPEAALEIGNDILAAYPGAYGDAVSARWRAKLGLMQAQDGDAPLINRFLHLLEQSRVDFTLGFRGLTQTQTLRDQFLDIDAYDAWLTDYAARLASENREPAQRHAAMDAVNPLYILRNHLAQIAIERAQAGDFSEIEHLLATLQRPYLQQTGAEKYENPPKADTAAKPVSCSS